MKQNATTGSYDMSFGTMITPAGVQFRLWAPAAETVELCLHDKEGSIFYSMPRYESGWFQLDSHEARPGSLYTYRIDGQLHVPDPASRFQPEGVHGPSQVVDPFAWQWQDTKWYGRPWHEAVIYELHVGAFTPAGSFKGVIEKLGHLKELGITAIELMPVACFAGSRNWGYDGVLPFAPHHAYGTPDDLKLLVQSAHQEGLMVFLDVVYNHFGPEGNYLHLYAPDFFTGRYETPWGEAINFGGPNSGQVRWFFIENALYWLTEFHFDGLRFDAVHAIFDETRPDILEEVAREVHRRLPADRKVHLVLENDNNAAHYLKPTSDPGRGSYQAQWNDDLHHCLHVLMTGEEQGYYVDYIDKPLTHLGRCLAEGFAYQGQNSRYRQGARRGEASKELPAGAFVSFLQNHDQIGNRAHGERITELTSEEALRAATVILLLSPPPPLLFMGQEWGALQPFPFFCDFGEELAALVYEGRMREFASFPQFLDPESRSKIPDPNHKGTFESAALDWRDLTNPSHAKWLAFHQKLLTIRRREIMPYVEGFYGISTEFKQIGDYGLFVGWHHDKAGALNMIANLNDRHDINFTRPKGRLLYVCPEKQGQLSDKVTMPPWTVAFFSTLDGLEGAS